MITEGIILSVKRKNTVAVAGVPLAAVSACPRIEFVGNREVIVDGCRGVAEYGEDLIRLNISGGSVCFYGQGLEITRLYGTEATVKGYVHNMEFCL